jgi:hypothetical protein
MPSWYRLEKSPRKNKKLRVIFPDGGHLDFGAAGYSDYTIHKDKERMKRYLIRHRDKEDWTVKSGVYTPGFWARWILWSEPNLRDAVARTAKLLKARVVLGR